MSTPHSTGPKTRSTTKKTENPSLYPQSPGASPALGTSRKRRNSVELPLYEPPAKRMADSQLMEAINGIKNSVSAMEQQMRNVPSKADLNTIVTEIRGVKETVIRNTDRIDTLFDLRKKDGEILAKRVEQIVEGRMAKNSRGRSRPVQSSENERAFLRSRRSIRIWPIGEAAGLEEGVTTFLKKSLCIPETVVDGLTLERVEKLSQTRRSKVQDGVLVTFETAQQRDVVQSYASNLAPIQGRAGLRLDIPDFLRGLFRLFESHAAALKAEYGSLKRAIRFDDAEQSLFMDVKLEDTDWHRISADDMRGIEERKKASRQSNNEGLSAAARAEKRKILLQTESKTSGDPHVVSDEESEPSLPSGSK